MNPLARYLLPVLLAGAPFATAVAFAGEETPPGPAAAEGEAPPVPETSALDFSALETLAIQDDVRRKPLGTFACEILEQITGRSFLASAPSFRPTDGPVALTGMDLFCSIAFHARDWTREPLILVNYGPLRKEVGLDEDRARFSLAELEPLQGLQALAEEDRRKRHENRAGEITPSEAEAARVGMRMWLLRERFSDASLDLIPHPSRPDGAWISLPVLVALRKDPEQALRYLASARTAGNPKRAAELMHEYIAAYNEETVQRLQSRYDALAAACRKRDPETFARAASAFREAVLALSLGAYPGPAELAREVHYGQLRPFREAWLAYLAAAVLALVFFKTRHQAVRGVIWAVFLAGMAFHLYGFVLRALIAGRAPVSNMYESVIWAGLGCALFGLIFELMYRPRYFLLSGALGAWFFLVLMDFLPAVTGDVTNQGYDARIQTFQALEPLLKHHFWLTIHVLVITISYSAFALAWVLAHASLGQHLLRPAARAEHGPLLQYIYKTLQTGVFLLAVGTVLGAFWGKYAWGRFWGWDAKEVWALVSLLCYIVVLHARHTGWWSDFGFAVGADVCFLSVVMAWYGVNFVLGSGKHTYGTGAGGLGYVVAAVVLDLLFVAAAIARYLRHRPRPGEPAPRA